MIFKGKSRKDGGQLASYLLSPKNEQVRIWDVQGTVVNTRTPQGLREAMRDFDELGKMTKGEKTIFHLALSPNEKDHLSEADWFHAICKAEEALGLEGQPRVVVSHTYRGKEHLHAVWTRVNIDQAKCVQLSHSHLKLCQAAREVERELGLEITPDRKQRSEKSKRSGQEKLNAEKHQIDRAAQNPKIRNLLVTTAWMQAKTPEEFREKMEVAGYHLAIGKRGIIAVDDNHEPHSLARCLKGYSHRDIQVRLAVLTQLPSLEELKAAITEKANLTHDVYNSLVHRRSSQLTHNVFLANIVQPEPLLREKDRDCGFEP